jgi:methylmalonyl-CoA mutase
MMSRLDPWNNILRGTLATFSAAIGGADTITVLPFTQALGAPDAFAHRLARDTQLVLQDESHLEAVDDPTSGAGSFEALTQELCGRAWDDFQKIEAQGGVSKALENGTLQGSLAETAGLRAKNIARAREKLIGVNEFPDIHEKELHVLSSYDTRWRSLTAPKGALTSPAITPRRLSEPFEALRDASDVFLKQIGARPKIFLANLGPIAAFTARANFSKNFFEAGGIEAIFGPETDKNDDIIEAFRKSGARLACLCSSDRFYGEKGEQLAKELKQAGAKLYLAGRPGELEQKMRQSGIERFIYVGCDMYEILRDAFDEAK